MNDKYTEIEEKHPKGHKLRKIPHKDGNGKNVGCLLSKNYTTHMEQGILGGVHPSVSRVFEISIAVSYWTSVQSRVKELIVRQVDNPHGKPCLLAMPPIVPSGTVTRRTVAPLLATMCSCRSHKIGTELKSRIKAPDGWSVVQGDIDQEELQIAATFADYQEGKFTGASPMTFEIMLGSKDDGTDGHTRTARALLLDDLGYTFHSEHGWIKEIKE